MSLDLIFDELYQQYKLPYKTNYNKDDYTEFQDDFVVRQINDNYKNIYRFPSDKKIIFQPDDIVESIKLSIYKSLKDQILSILNSDINNEMKYIQFENRSINIRTSLQIKNNQQNNNTCNTDTRNLIKEKKTVLI